MDTHHLIPFLQSVYLRILQLCLIELKKLSSIFYCDHREAGHGATFYKNIQICVTTGREHQTVVSDIDGTLTRSRSRFAYFMLVAFEAGSPVRGLLLLLCWPLAWLMQAMVSEAMSMHILIFVSVVGLKESDLEGVGRAVLCRFYLEDMHPHSYKVLLSCRRRCVVTGNPRVMVEPFLKDYLGVDIVLGTELHTVKGLCTGFLKGRGIVVGTKKRQAVKEAFPDMLPHLGLANKLSDSAFLSLCKEGYMVTDRQVKAVPKEEYPKPLIFHDGRLAIRPTPMVAAFIYLWLPLGLALSILRITSWLLLPAEISVPIAAVLGMKVRICGTPPLPKEEKGIASAGGACVGKSKGVLYVCTHRTLMDPIFLSVALRRRVAAVTYSLSRVSELMSPIKTVRLTRNREEDARTIERALSQGDLVICPEGTTCREPYLLRFSPLFAEITNEIVPVGMRVSTTLFHGTTARGFKGMDPFYFLMNPCPAYTVTILDPLPKEETCASGKSSCHVANHVQKLMSHVMGYECTTLTRKDKYRILANNDGLVATTKAKPSPRVGHNNSTILCPSSLWSSLCKSGCYPSKKSVC